MMTIFIHVQKVLTLEKSFSGVCECIRLCILYEVLILHTVISTATEVLAEVFPCLQIINLMHHSK